MLRASSAAICRVRLSSSRVLLRFTTDILRERRDGRAARCAQDWTTCPAIALLSVGLRGTEIPGGDAHTRPVHMRQPVGIEELLGLSPVIPLVTLEELAGA